MIFILAVVAGLVFITVEIGMDLIKRIVKHIKK